MSIIAGIVFGIWSVCVWIANGLSAFWDEPVTLGWVLGVGFVMELTIKNSRDKVLESNQALAAILEAHHDRLIRHNETFHRRLSDIEHRVRRIETAVVGE